MAKKLLAEVVAKLPAPTPAADAEQVTTTRSGEVFEARSTSARIKTVEDLLRHIEADMQAFEVEKSEATKWECASSDGDGGTTVTELHRVFVRLKPRAGPGKREMLEAMIASASKVLRQPPKAKRLQPSASGLWQVLVIADPHFGKYAWGKTTGHDDYDLSLAQSLVGDAAAELLEIGDVQRPERRTIALLGDLFHYDTPGGTTTSGTPLERDGRLQKMIEVGSDCLLGIIERSGDTVPTDVVIVNGNHDEVLTWGFQRIMQERFRRHKNVTIKGDYTGRQYLSHGNTLLGFAHGHKAKRKLPQIMALEASQQWSKCGYREWHTGHFHSQAAEHQRPLETIDAVTVRTAPALCPPDDWHSIHGFICSRQAMESFTYRNEGGLASINIAGPRPRA